MLFWRTLLSRVQRVLSSTEIWLTEVLTAPCGVLERIWDLGLEATLGNHDDLLRMWVDKDETLPPEWFTSPFWLATAWAAEQIESHGLMNRIRGLPMMLKLELPSAPSILIAHGSPRHYREGLSEWLTDESLSEILAEKSD